MNLSINCPKLSWNGFFSDNCLFLSICSTLTTCFVNLTVMVTNCCFPNCCFINCVIPLFTDIKFSLHMVIDIQMSWWYVLLTFSAVPFNRHGFPYTLRTKFILIEILHVEPSFKLQWCHARDLFGSQIPVPTGRFELWISCIWSSYLTH